MQYFPPYLFDHEKPFSHRITILYNILLKMWSLAQAVLQDKEFRPEYELAISLSHCRVRLTLLFSLALLSQ